MASGKRKRRPSGSSDSNPPLYQRDENLIRGVLLKRVSDNNRRQLIERTRHAWGLYNTQDEEWPYHGEVLRWQLSRWVAIFFGAVTILVTFFIARSLFIRLPLPYNAANLALGSAAIVAFIPRYVLTGSMLNYETMLAFFGPSEIFPLLS